MTVFNNGNVYVTNKLLDYSKNKRSRKYSIILMKNTDSTKEDVFKIITSSMNIKIVDNDFIEDQYYLKKYVWIIEKGQLFGELNGKRYLPYLTTIDGSNNITDTYLASRITNSKPISIDKVEINRLAKMTDIYDTFEYKIPTNSGQYLNVNFSTGNFSVFPTLNIEYVLLDSSSEYKTTQKPNSYLMLFYPDIYEVLKRFGKYNLQTLDKKSFNKLNNILTHIEKSIDNKEIKTDNWLQLSNVNYPTPYIPVEMISFLVNDRYVYQDSDVVSEIEKSIGKRDSYFLIKQFYTNLTKEINTKNRSNYSVLDVGKSNIGLKLLENYFSK